MLRSVLALALVAALSTHAFAMSQMDLPASYPPPASYIDGAMIGLAASALLLIAGGWLRAPNSVRSLPWAVGCMLLMTSACLAASDGTEPDPVLTPGAVRTTDRAEICGHTTREFREVTLLEKIAARRAYGILPPRDGWCAAGTGCDTEIDHLIPLTVGGGNPPGSIANLWPMRGDGPNNYHVKDLCELRVGRALCAGKISVEAAQDLFRHDWRVGCAPYLVKPHGRRAAKPEAGR